MFLPPGLTLRKIAIVKLLTSEDTLPEADNKNFG